MTHTYYPLARLVQSIALSTSWGAYKRSCLITALMLYIQITSSSHMQGTHFNPCVERVHWWSKITCQRLQCYRDIYQGYRVQIDRRYKMCQHLSCLCALFPNVKHNTILKKKTINGRFRINRSLNAYDANSSMN